jgi:hypothetical protein
VPKPRKTLTSTTINLPTLTIPFRVLSSSTLPHQFNVSMLCIYLQLHNFSSPLETINKVDAVDDCKYINSKSPAPNTKGCTFKKSSVQLT